MTAVEFSKSGRAPKNDPAIFVLAMAASAEDPETRRAAFAALPEVCRIGTHLFHFVTAVQEMRGWGRGLKNAIGNWYRNHDTDSLAFEVLKYQQRDGMSHRDVLRLAHPSFTGEQSAIARWVVAGAENMGKRTIMRKIGDKNKREIQFKHTLHPLLEAYEELKTATSTKQVTKLIQKYGFTHEMIPNQWKNEIAVWEALVQNMPITATIRNLGKMTDVGLIAPFAKVNSLIADRITDKGILTRGRVHPIQLLSALRVYEQGHGERGKLEWEPVTKIVDALNEAFYTSFQSIEPTGKATLLALDISSSMDGGEIAGIPGLTPRDASAAMAMVTARTENNYAVVGFSHQLVKLPISPTMRLNDVINELSKHNFGGTDASLPMIWAKKASLRIDSFAVYTDNETWAGQIHPYKALQEYRKFSGRLARLAVVGLTATECSIADPNDPGMMDFIGFDAAAPRIMSDFFRGSTL